MSMFRDGSWNLVKINDAAAGIAETFIMIDVDGQFAGQARYTSTTSAPMNEEQITAELTAGGVPPVDIPALFAAARAHFELRYRKRS